MYIANENGKIVLTTITNVSIALEWIKSTFLYIRMRKSPKNYDLDPTISPAQLDEYLKGKPICISVFIADCVFRSLPPSSARTCSTANDYNRWSDRCHKSTAFSQPSLSSHTMLTHHPSCYLAIGKSVARYYIRVATISLIHSTDTNGQLETLLSVFCRAQVPSYEFLSSLIPNDSNQTHVTGICRHQTPHARQEDLEWDQRRHYQDALSYQRQNQPPAALHHLRSSDLVRPFCLETSVFW